MTASLFDLLFGCRHSEYSWPMTIRWPKNLKHTAARLTGMYVVCMDCGREFAYDWKQMKVISEREQDLLMRTQQVEA
jgi:hypothetical protein